jgi:hypothetical protein
MPDSSVIEKMQRLGKMSRDEIRVRVQQECYKRWDLARSVFVSPWRIGKNASGLEDGSKYFLSHKEISECCDWFRSNRPDVTENAIAYADRILRHEFDLLGYAGVRYGGDINWHLDAVHGKSAPTKPWFQIPYLDFARVGDHKVTWELNRHQHLVALAKAYRFTGNIAYAEELFRQWYQWQKENPYPYGINWASSLEIAFRSLAWRWVWYLLEGCDVVPRTFESDLGIALENNARHIERYLSTYFAANTHLLGEAVGLFFIGTLLRASASAAKWRQTGWRIVLEQAERQVRPDGMHFEQSSHYHTYALDFFLHARILAERNGQQTPKALDATIENMLKATCELASSRCLPQFGDDDGGRVFDGRRNRREHMVDPLAIGAALFNRADFKATVGDATEEMVWLLGTAGAGRFESLPNVRPLAHSFALRASGIYAMASDEPIRGRLLIEAGPHGAGWAGHGHADALSVQVDIDGEPVLIDRGTYSYVNNAGERSEFRKTASHNTVEIDGVSQSEELGPFKWKSPCDAKADSWITGETFDLFSGSHGGYERLAGGVVHKRDVFHLKGGFWLVRDMLQGAGTHRAQLSWNLAAGELQPTSKGFQISRNCKPVLSLIHASDAKWDSRTYQDWYSPRYGSRESCSVLRLSATVQLPAECATVLFPGPLKDACFESGADAVAQYEGCRPYRLKTGGVLQEAIFATAPGGWKASRIASDAQFVYAAFSPAGTCQRYVVCSGTYLDVDGERLFTSDVPHAAGEHSIPRAGTSDSQQFQAKPSGCRDRLMTATA